MKIARKDLLCALAICLKVVPRNGNLPILSNVLIDGPGQKISATDLETSVVVPVEISDWKKVVSVPGELPEDDELDGLKKAQLQRLADDFGIEIPKKGKLQEIVDAIWAAMRTAADGEATDQEMLETYCLNARDFQAIARTLEEDDVEVTATNEKADLFGSLVSIGKNFRNLYATDTSEFPEIPEVVAESHAAVSQASLAAVLPAVLREDGRTALQCVCFEKGKACATDGHRIHLVDTTETAEKSFLLSVVAAKACHAIGGESIRLGVDADAGHVVMETEKARLVTRTVDAVFPDFDQVVPKSAKHKVSIKKSDVTKALTQALLMGSEKYQGMRMTFNTGIDIEVTNPEKGEYQRANVPLASGVVKPELQTAFNPRYFRDVVNTVDDDTEIQIALKKDVDPIVFTHGTFKAVVMPMRI